MVDLKTNQSKEIGNLGLHTLETFWIDATEKIFLPIIQADPTAEFLLRIQLEGRDYLYAPSVYFFVYNRITKSWNCNHV